MDCCSTTAFTTPTLPTAYPRPDAPLSPPRTPRCDDPTKARCTFAPGQPYKRSGSGGVAKTRLCLQLVFWLAMCLAGIVTLLLIGPGGWTAVLGFLFALGLMAIARRIMRREPRE